MVNTLLNTKGALPHILAYNNIKNTLPDPIIAGLLTTLRHRGPTKKGVNNVGMVRTNSSSLSPLCEPSLSPTNTGTTKTLAKNLIDFQRTCKGLKLDREYIKLAHDIKGRVEPIETAFDSDREQASFRQICNLMDCPLVVIRGRLSGLPLEFEDSDINIYLPTDTGASDITATYFAPNTKDFYKCRPRDLQLLKKFIKQDQE